MRMLLRRVRSALTGGGNPSRDMSEQIPVCSCGRRCRAPIAGVPANAGEPALHCAIFSRSHTSSLPRTQVEFTRSWAQREVFGRSRRRQSGAGAVVLPSDLPFHAGTVRRFSRLHALDVVDGQGPGPALRAARGGGNIAGRFALQGGGNEPVALISLIQSHREIAYSAPTLLPQQDALRSCPIPLREPILYVTEMQTARIDDLPPDESEALLQQLFGCLYAPANVYEHRWRMATS